MDKTSGLNDGVRIPGRGRCSSRTTAVDARVKYQLYLSIYRGFFFYINLIFIISIDIQYQMIKTYASKNNPLPRFTGHQCILTYILAFILCITINFGVVCVCARFSMTTMIVKPTVASVASQLASLCNKFDSMKENFDDMKAEFSNLNSVLTTKCQKIKSLTAEVSTFRKKFCSWKILSMTRTLTLGERPLFLMKPPFPVMVRKVV